MADSSPVILQRIDAGLMASMPKPRPDAVFVLSYGGGGLKTFTRTPPMSERMGSKYCYIVDASERHARRTLHIPARGDVYFFAVNFDANWQVTDPQVVVRHNVRDGDAVVAGYLEDALWRMGRAYPPDDVQGAEDQARQSLRAPFQLDGGLTVTRLSLRLTLDERQAGAAVEVDADVHAGHLAGSRVQRLRNLLDGDESFLLLHLAQHPDDTGSVLQMLAAARERGEQSRLGLLDRMLDHGFIQDADIGPLRDGILGTPGASALPPNRPMPPAAALPPTPAAAPPVGSPDTGPSGAATTGRATVGAAAGKEDEAGAAAAPPPAPGNVTTWKPVGSGKSGRGPA